MENLIRIREPLAWAMVVLSALMLVYLGVELVWYSLAGMEWYQVGDRSMPPISIGWIFGWQGVDYALLLVLVVAVAGCWFPPVVARARTIALAAAWVTTVTVALPWLVLAFALLVWPRAALASVMLPEWWSWLGLLHPAVATGVGVVAAIALWALARPPAEQDESDELAAELDPAEPDEAEDEHPTVWKPSEATGTVWRTADEAAAGAPGSRFLDPEKTSPEWADDASRPEAGRPDDWRPPTNS